MDLTARAAAKDQKAEFGSVAALAPSPPSFCSIQIFFLKKGQISKCHPSPLLSGKTSASRLTAQSPLRLFNVNSNGVLFGESPREANKNVQRYGLSAHPRSVTGSRFVKRGLRWVGGG